MLSNLDIDNITKPVIDSIEEDTEHILLTILTRYNHKKDYDDIVEYLNISYNAKKRLISSVYSKVYKDINHDYKPLLRHKIKANRRYYRDNTDKIVNGIILSTISTIQSYMFNTYVIVNNTPANLKKFISSYDNVLNTLDNSNDQPIRDSIIQDVITNGLRTARKKDGKITYPQIKVAVKEILNNNIIKLEQDVYNATKNDIYADGVELSAHIASAPDHEPCQGRVFTNKEFKNIQQGKDFKDINGNHYIGFTRPIMYWNCRHYVIPFIIGKSKRHYTDRYLSKLIRDNKKGVSTSDGKHYTLYQATQRKRECEDLIHKYETGVKIYKVLKDDKMLQKYETKLKNYKNKYKKLL